MTTRRFTSIAACAIAVLVVGIGVGRAVDPMGVRASEGTSQEGVALTDYREAFDAYLTCVSDAGITVGEISEDRFGHLGAQLAAPQSTMDPSDFHSKTEQCRREHLDAAEIAWVRAHPPSEEESAEARNMTADCLAGSGISITRPVSRNALQKAIVENITSDSTRLVVGSCLNATAEQMNWPGYGGS